MKTVTRAVLAAVGVGVAALGTFGYADRRCLGCC